VVLIRKRGKHAGKIVLQRDAHIRGTLVILLSVSFSPDGKWIASAGSYPERKDPSEIVIWDAQTGQERLTLKGHSESVHSVSFSPDGKRIVSGGSDKTIKVWDISSLDTSK